jgi:hypothetical protein
MGLRATGGLREARTLIKEAWTDLQRASHDEVFTVARNDLGEMRNWEALVDAQRCELVHWVRNNLAEFTGVAIYRLHGWWCPIWRRRVGGWREGKCTGAGYLGFTVAKPLAMDGLTTTIHCDMLKLLGTWRMDGKQPRPARIISVGHRPSGYGELSSDQVRANTGAKIFYSPRLSTLCWARITATGANPREVTGGEVQRIWDFSGYCTMAIIIRSSDSTTWGALFSIFHVTTY